MDDLVVRDGAAALRLPPLPPDEALDLVVRVAGRQCVDADPTAAADVVRTSGSTPLALRAAAVRLGDTDRMTARRGAVIHPHPNEPQPTPTPTAGVGVGARTRWLVLVGVVGAVGLALVAGVVGLSDVIDRATLHAVVATRGGQLATVGLGVLAGCVGLLRPVARLAGRRPWLAAGCVVGVAGAVLVTVVRTPFGPPALVDAVRLVGVAVWVGVVGVAGMVVLPALRNKFGYAVGIVLGIAGTWVLVARILGDGTATNQTYGHLLLGGATLFFAVVGVSTVRRRRRSAASGGGEAAKVVIGAVAVLLAVSVLATVPGPAAPRGRHKTYDSMVYGLDIESRPASSQTG
jgi:hypothetical protein